LKVNKHLNKIMLLFHLRSWIFQKFLSFFHLKKLLENGLITILLWRVFLEGYIFLNGIQGKLQFLKYLREKKWLYIFWANCLNILCPFFKEQLFFFSFPQKLVVGGLILEKFPESIMGFNFILGMRGKFGNFIIVQMLFFYLLSKICFFF
jgi:hypothetical protein